MYLETCCLCLSTSQELEHITKIHKDKSSALVKLKETINEINWLENFMICLDCESELNKFHCFRRKCIENYNSLIGMKLEPKVEIVSDYESQEIPDNSESDTKESKYSKNIQRSCQVCSVPFTITRTLIGHCIEIHGLRKGDIKPFECKVCLERFETHILARKHNLTKHRTERPHLCKYCGKTCLSKFKLRVHENIHENERKFKCEPCQKDFNTAGDLRSHNYTVHTDPLKWKYICSVCDKRFPGKSNYQRHMRCHTGEKPFKCQLCDKSFADQYGLRDHLVSHSNVCQYKCDLCDKAYKLRNGLYMHKAKVHNLGNYKASLSSFSCSVCSKQFTARNKLEKHMYIHSREKPFSERKFIDKTCMKQNIKSAHPEIELV